MSLEEGKLLSAFLRRSAVTVAMKEGKKGLKKAASEEKDNSRAGPNKTASFRDESVPKLFATGGNSAEDTL